MNSPPRILIACIGNIFLGDDAFGVRVAERLGPHQFPENVRCVDFGIRGIDLTYALLDGCDIAILVDAAPRGERPGTLYVMEPKLDYDENASAAGVLEGHSMQPVKVLQQVRAMGGQVRRVLLLGCEPTPLDSDQEMSDQLSPPVAQAIEPAIEMLQSLVSRLCADPTTKEVRHAFIESVP